jgi:hypothetical protein
MSSGQEMEIWICEGRKTVPLLSLLVVNLSATISRSSFLHTKHSQIFAEQRTEGRYMGNIIKENSLTFSAKGMD